MESDNFQYEREMKWDNAGEGVVRQIMAYNDDLMMVKVKFETGAVGTPHTHPGDLCGKRCVRVYNGWRDKDRPSGRRRLHETGCPTRLQVPGGRRTDRHIQPDAQGFSVIH